ncbi:MAG: HD-GYP domain-containing protein [Gemmatimonadaceae bacterium]
MNLAMTSLMQKQIVVAAGAGAGAAAMVMWARRSRREKRLAERLAAAALESLLNTVDANDAETGAHVRRVAAFSCVLSQAADLTYGEQKSVERVALFHDIGKIHAALFDIVHEHAKLSPEESRLVATHPVRGADVLRPLAAFYPDLAEGVLSHHEHWDGSGYPRGLRGARIPLSARIVAIADTFDVITFGRPYRSPRTFAQAAEQIALGAGTQFDPVLTDLFLSPPIFKEIRQAVRAHQALKPERGCRRKKSAPPDVPDITFRWRSESLAQTPQGQSPRIPRE